MRWNKNIFLIALALSISFYLVFAAISSVTLNAPADLAFDNDGTVIFNCTAVVSAPNTIANLTLYGNWTGTWHANLTNSTTVTNGTGYNFTPVTGLADGNYIWNCFAYDNNTLSNVGTSNYTITVDSTAPVVTLISPANLSTDTDGTVRFSYNVTDVTTEVTNCSLYISSVLNTTNLTITEDATLNFSLTGVSASDALTWFVSCYDNLTNQGNSTIYYLDTYDNPATTTNPGGYNGQTHNEGQLEGMHLTLTRLRNRDRVRFTFENEIHNAEIKSMGSDYIDMEVSSDPVTVRIDVGEEELFDLNGDGVYDLSITLNSILTNRADITFKEYVETITPPADDTCTESWTCGEWGACVNEEKTRTCTDLNSCGTETNKPNVMEACETGVVDSGEITEETTSYAWVWIIVVVIIIVLYFVIANKKKK